jgi:dynein heavy chain
MDRLEEVDRYLEHDKAKFQTDLVRDQEMYQYELEDLGRTVVAFSERNEFSKVAEYADDVERIQAQLRNAQAKAAKYNSREHLFEFELTEYSDLDKIIKSFEPYANFWTSAANWIKWKKEWSSGAFADLDPEAMDAKLTGAWKTMYRSIKFFQDRNTRCLQIATDLKQEMDAFKPSMPLITSLRNRGMRDRHWADLAAETGHDLSPTPEQTLQGILALDLAPHMEAITKVCELAGKEYSIEEALDNMEEAWKGVAFDIVAYRASGTFVMRGSDDIVQLLDDHTAMTQSMSFSVFKKPFEERIGKWEAKLNLISDVVDEWLACQRSWLYLEPIFSSDDINRQMPTEGKRFTNVDRMWRKIMNQASATPEVMAVAAVDKVLENFRECNKLLDMIQKGLSDYLETKCAAFSRFYFLSPDELLQILSQTKDPTAVQPHLRKCFEAIASVTFQEDLEITHIVSAESEVIPLAEPFYPKGNVEAWLLELERSMRKSLKGILTAAVHSYKKHPRTDWVRMYPGQITIAASQIHWSVEVETAIRKGGVAGLERLYKKLLRQLDDLTGLVRGELTTLERITLGSLIVIDVHARDVVKRLIDAGVADVNDFDWISQLRYYWVGNDCEVRMVNARYMYGYEYLGNTGRLVITPLTDRCYMTLMGALHLQLGGAPQGPAGTGKTETCKDLAKALAKQCVVFNCSDGLDYLAMGKFFKGLASSGAWACFDEFNRIDLEVLSVIAQQIITIQKAIQNGLKRFFFEGTEIGLDPTCAVFITMNPGYAGRTELPDNLKALFRPVAMMIPDYALIAEIMLFSYGFSDAHTLARKMVATFRLSSEQLSSQDHYDFGMRAVKTVISAAGNLKRADPDLDEALLLLRALKDVNLPKFLAEDIPLFEGIISDLFPGVTDTKGGASALGEAIASECLAMGLRPHPAFVHKVEQLYETLVVRHGVMLVGPTGGGKTCNYKVLARAMTALRNDEVPGFEAVHYSIINPKSITMGQLYGQYDENTHEWTDGVLAALVRNGSEDTRPDKNWVVFDGPVDAIWIENMNTVLDDNKKLCLNSGEIIKLSAAMSMMFEVEDLAVASPATVSRCGMVYMEPTQLGTAPLIESYMDTAADLVRSPAVADKLRPLMEALVDPALAALRRSMSEIVGSVDNNLVCSLFRILDCLFVPYLPSSRGGEEKPAEQKDLHLVTEPLFLFALIWSVGGTCDAASRARFDTWMREEVGRLGLGTEFPKEGLVYDYHYDTASRSWVNWMETVPEFFCDPKAEFFSIMVPTIDTVRQTFMLDLLAMQGKPVLCVGDTGTGKTVNVRNKLLKGLPQNYTPVFVSFSARTSANQTQDILDAKMDRRRKGVFGPPAGKRYVVFVDDVNMPAREVYGAQPPVELLRQWLDHGGWYDRKLLSFKEIIDTQFVCAMGPPGGGRNPVTNRFLRQFNMLAYPRIGDDSVSRIFGTIFASHLHSAANGFSEELRALAQPLTEATVAVYNTISAELLPTPSKSHYTFNLRDLAKVFQGTLLARMFHPSVNAEAKRQVKPRDLVRLWAHETTRVFEDRLVDAADREWFQKLITRQITEGPSKTLTEACPTFEGTSAMLYGDFSVRNAFPRLYTEIRDRDALAKVLDGYLEDYNAESTTPMNLVLFSDAVSHLARISRVIRQPLGHALLLGVGGSGRQSLSRLAAHMAEYHLKQIEVAKGYGHAEWRDDLKALMAVAGLENKPSVFLFSDTQIVQESFLEDINGILNAGDVPNMYTQEELDHILTEVGNDARKAGVASDKASLYDFYVQRCRRNVHVVLAMSPVGEVFRARLRQFPALVNSCTIDWFSEWPDEALQSVATALLQGLDLGPEPVRIAVTSMFTGIHQSVASASARYALELRRHNHVTPTSFLEVITTFRTLLAGKRSENANMSKRLEIGLDKLEATGAEVGVMQQELVALQPVLVQTTKEAEQMMVAIAKDKRDADVTKAEVVREKAEAAKQTEETSAIAADAQKDLDEALPALEEAVASLRTLDKSAINEVQSMLRPPQGVRTVMEAVCIMRGVKPARVAGDKPGEKVLDYWPSSQAMLRDPGFMNALMTFDKDNVPESIIDKIQPYIQSESFTPQAVAKVSKACTSLCMWVRAMEKYYWVAKAVAPKKAKLREAEDSLRVTMESLDRAKQRLQAVEDNIRGLERKYDDMLAKKDEYQRKVQDCEAKLDRAQKLIGGLGGEKDRWTATIRSLAVDFDNLVGDVLLSAGVVAYQGSFTGPYRAQLTRQWREKISVMQVPHTPNCSLTSTLGDPVAVRMWNVHGLPSDAHSVENGIIISRARRWPLMIDPQGQANRWVKNMEMENGLDVIRLSEKDFLRSLENGVRFGKPVLLENIGEELDPALEPLLLKQTFRQGGSEVIRLGDAVIPYHPDFRFYITTKLPNPHYAPESQVKVTLLNFTITPEGMEDQLLGIVVAKERPDLEEMKSQLTVSNAKMRKELKDLEDRILELRSTSQGNILDDESLIEVLSQSKRTSEEITIKVAEAETTEREIDSTRLLYKPVAFRASIMFFCIADLAAIDPMYQYSLMWFTNLFSQSFARAPASTVLDERLASLTSAFTEILYNNVCRSLFERHKLLFSFLLAIRLESGDGKVDPAELRFLIAGGSAPDAGTRGNPAPEWLSARSWSEIVALSQLPSFVGFADTFATNVAFWKRYFDDAEPHKLPLPGKLETQLSVLQRLVIVRALRPDRVTAAVQGYVAASMGRQYIEPPSFSISGSFGDSDPATPLVFILSTGSDPAADLYKFADEMRFGKKLQGISLGQGQGPRAEALIREATDRGTWVLLQNCHLAISWMPALERFCESLDPQKVHRDFRLWLTSMPSDKFPVSVLQNSVKMTLEPPKGLKANLLQSYDGFDDSFLNSECAKPTEWKKLLFSLCFFHASILERRSYGALGWNVLYEFSRGDLAICVRQLAMFLDEYKQAVPWKVLLSTAGDVNYGGRVTDDWDRRTLKTILRGFYNPEVLGDGYKFSALPEYYSIPATDVKGYRDYLRDLPINDSPLLYGLHENADVTKLSGEAAAMFDSLLRMQPRTSTGGGKSREEAIEDLARSLLERVPPEFDTDTCAERFPVAYAESMNTVLVQEQLRYQKVLRVARRSLENLLKALKGLVVMSGELEMVASALFDNRVPELWSAVAYPSLKPLASWVSDLIRRCETLSSWEATGTHPPAYWISGFYFPQAFITGTLQNFARKYGVAIDQVSFDYQVLDTDPADIAVGPEDGCYIYGAFLEGARWDAGKRCLAEARDKELFSAFPVVHLQPISNREPPTEGVYVSPMYKTTARHGVLSTTGHSSNFITSIEIPSLLPMDHWVRRGTALVCSLPE